MKLFNVGNISTHALLNKCIFILAADDTQTLGYSKKELYIISSNEGLSVSKMKMMWKKYFAILPRIPHTQ